MPHTGKYRANAALYHIQSVGSTVHRLNTKIGTAIDGHKIGMIFDCNIGTVFEKIDFAMQHGKSIEKTHNDPTNGDSLYRTITYEQIYQVGTSLAFLIMRVFEPLPCYYPIVKEEHSRRITPNRMSETLGTIAQRKRFYCSNAAQNGKVSRRCEISRLKKRKIASG